MDAERTGVIPGESPLRAGLRRWIANALGPYAAEWERDGAVPAEVFRSFARDGYLALGYPRELGGGGCGFVEQLVVAEELYYSGWGGVALSLLGHSGIALQPLLILGSAEQKERYLRPALEGVSVTALAVTEPGAGSDVGAVTTRARPVDGGWRIAGREVFVTLGAHADAIIVAARTSDEQGYRGLSLFVVPGDAPGLSVVRSMDKLGMRSSNTAELRFDDCRVGDAALLGPERHGLQDGYAPVPGRTADPRDRRGRHGPAGAGRGDLLRPRTHAVRPRALVVQALRHRIADAASSLEALRTFALAVGSQYAGG